MDCLAFIDITEEEDKLVVRKFLRELIFLKMNDWFHYKNARPRRFFQNGPQMSVTNFDWFHTK